jgi:hypothetical protein
MIPKQLKKRHPDELVLATFRIPYQKWEKFQEAASASGTTASATLLAFIEDYLARFNAGNQPALLDSVESSLDAEVEVPAASQLPEQSQVNSELATTEVPELNRDFIPAIEPQIQKLLEAKIEEKLEAKMEEKLEEKLEAKLEAKIEDIEPMMHRIQSQVSQLSKRLGKVEQILEKFKGSKTKKTSEFIDVDAVPIEVESDLNQHDLESDRPLTEDDENDSGLTQTALCIEFGINPNTLNRHASVRGLSTMEYLHQLTGWLYRNGKYYPPK